MNKDFEKGEFEKVLDESVPRAALGSVSEDPKGIRMLTPLLLRQETFWLEFFGFGKVFRVHVNRPEGDVDWNSLRDPDSAGRLSPVLGANAVKAMEGREDPEGLTETGSEIGKCHNGLSVRILTRGR